MCMKYVVSDKEIFKLHKHSMDEYVSAIIFCFCAYLSVFIILFATCFTSSYVYGPSMQPTINNYIDYEHNMDIVYINKTANYTYGDIIVIQKPDLQIIKRVIAMPGDEINIVHVGSEYYVERNGEKLIEHYLRIVADITDSNGMKHEYDNFQIYKEENKETLNFVDKVNYINSAIVVPQGQVFVLGDNRHNSEDSARVGCFDMGKVIGRVDIIVYHGEKVLIKLLNYFYNPFK